MLENKLKAENEDVNGKLKVSEKIRKQQKKLIKLIDLVNKRLKVSEKIQEQLNAKDEIKDQWTDKEIRNFDAYTDNQYQVIPNHYNKHQMNYFYLKN